MTRGALTREYGDRPATKELRVRFIMHLMASGRWETGETGHELEEAWDLSVDCIKKDAAEASRRLKAVVDVDWVRSRLGSALDEALEDARRDPKATAAVANAFAAVIGVSRQNVTVSSGEHGQPVFRIEVVESEKPK